MVAASEIPINANASALQMANAIFGAGVSVQSASYTGSWYSSGIYSNGDSVSSGVMPGDTGVILSTGSVRNFTDGNGQANNGSTKSTNSQGPNNQSDFNALAGTNTYDAAYLDIDFIPTGSTMTMQFVFSSEEYPEYANSVYNDMAMVWVNGSPVPIAVGDGQTAVGNINGDENENLYISNENGDYNTEMDGFTVTMTLTMQVNPGVLNSIRIGVADVSDSVYDSNLLIAGDSIQTELVAIEDNVTVGVGGTKTIDALANDIAPNGSVLTITQINGVNVNAGDSVTLAQGQTATLNANGTITITTDTDVEETNFTYTVEDTTTGNTDVGFVTVNTVPCFVAGTLIQTPYGERPVEELTPGDMILTQDDGPQPLRWIGSREVAAIGKLAPIRIRAGTFGAHRELMVSPQHRVLIRDSLADLLFGDAEVLVAAKDLVNDHSVRRVEGGQVTYVHLLFDRHQVVFSEGLPTESFFPGPQTTKAFEAEIIDEICTIFPELDPMTGEGYSPTTRRALRSFEARLLLAA
ncbi:Hint domain-containing protein [Cognatishimia sp. MH4019]|uniref:Hint domain-containing protein n=1 Tax=Cognatishimia sp. MH4019 TaxID=2854030 RepID=UPI001CD37CE5|nr:Hint domain-containing protein [Cognatishimia sp. MH4019]